MISMMFLASYLSSRKYNDHMKELRLKDLYDGNFYHVCTEGLEQTNLMMDDEDYRVSWNYLAFAAWRTGVEIVAFVLMSNHIHELIACHDKSHAGKATKLYKQLIGQYLKSKYGLTRILRGSHDSIVRIDTIQYLMNCIAYIFRNPVSAKVCKKPEDYMWSSYASCFNDNAKRTITQKVSELGFTKKRSILRTGMDLTPCPFRIDENGMITLDSFVRNDIVEKAFWNSGKSFLFHLGCCNDAKMEYELVYQPMMNISDGEMHRMISIHVAERFYGRTISELSTSEKCSILKSLFFSHKTTIPQLSRIIGLPRELVRRILSQ